MMTVVPTLPETAPFSAEQRAWLNGYLAGLFSRGPVDAGVSSMAHRQRETDAQPLIPLTILFGSQTGTAEALAKRAAKEAGKRGFAPTVLDMSQADLGRLAAERNLLIITSTYGDGEPPDNAKALHAALTTVDGGSPRYPQLRFAVCGLGDTAYTQFCRCAKDFDALFERHGATRVAVRADCDVDYEAEYSSWLDRALPAFGPAGTQAPSREPPSTATADTSERARAETVATFSRANPCQALVSTNRRLSGVGSAKQVHHVEIDLAGSGLAYEAGDALGVAPHNCPELVDEILSRLDCDGEEAVPAPDGSSVPLRRALSEIYDLGRPTTGLLALLGGASSTSSHDVADVLHARVDVKLNPSEIVGSLRRIQPRLYSISSSPKAHGAMVHLTVGALRYEAGGRQRKGVCSTFLAERVVPGVSHVGVHVHSNRSFRLPAAGDTSIVMVGPGTGIAPFRGFLHERRAAGARGQNWLFFGDQRESADFLYRDELLGMKTDGLLTRLDLAWSRDQQEKIYVQNRMLEHAAELYGWLENGAHFYVCGDASRMAKDVHAALHTVVEIAGAKTREQAEDYVQSLLTAKRYCRDVY